MIPMQTLLLPAQVFKAHGQTGRAVWCLLLQLSIIGWGFAVLWASSFERQSRADTCKAARYARMFGPDHPLTLALMSNEFDQQQSLLSPLPGPDRTDHARRSAEDDRVCYLDDRRSTVGGSATMAHRHSAGSGTSLHSAARHRP